MGAEGFHAVPAVHATADVIQAEVPEGVKQIGWRGAPLSRECSHRLVLADLLVLNYTSLIGFLY
jgi:hypothetical protein